MSRGKRITGAIPWHGRTPDNKPIDVKVQEIIALSGSGGVTEAAVRDAGRWTPLCNGITATPEIVFNLGDVIMVWQTGP